MYIIIHIKCKEKCLVMSRELIFVSCVLLKTIWWREGCLPHFGPGNGIIAWGENVPK